MTHIPGYPDQFNWADTLYRLVRETHWMRYFKREAEDNTKPHSVCVSRFLDRSIEWSLIENFDVNGIDAAEFKEMVFALSAIAMHDSESVSRQFLINIIKRCDAEDLSYLSPLIRTALGPESAQKVLQPVLNDPVWSINIR